MLAGLIDCSLTSLRYHAKRAGIEVTSGSGEASGSVTMREADGRFAFVEIRCTLDVAFSAAPERPGRTAREGRARLLRRRVAHRQAGLHLERRVRLLVLGGTKFLGRAFVEAALAGGHEVTLFNRGETNPGALPGGRAPARRPHRRPRRARGPGLGRRGRPVRLRPRGRRRVRAAPARGAALPLRLQHLRLRRLPRAARRGRPARAARARPADRPAARGLRELRRAEGALRAARSSRRSATAR